MGELRTGEAARLATIPAALFNVADYSDWLTSIPPYFAFQA